MARDSKGNDRAQILAVAAGEADISSSKHLLSSFNVVWKKRS